MCDNNKFYICEHCGNLIGMIHDAGVPMMCCGQKMTKLEPGVVEASHEKHIPVVSIDGNIVTVTIGSVEHPMLEEHHIEWVYLQTDKGGQRKCLEVGKPPSLHTNTAISTACGRQTSELRRITYHDECEST